MFEVGPGLQRPVHPALADEDSNASKMSFILVCEGLGMVCFGVGAVPLPVSQHEQVLVPASTWAWMEVNRLP